jgi:hypothetical protein
MSITAIVENDTIKLPPGVHVPDGTKAEITLPPSAGDSPADPFAEVIGAFAGPRDATGRNAEEILYGHGA